MENKYLSIGFDEAGTGQAYRGKSLKAVKRESRVPPIPVSGRKSRKSRKAAFPVAFWKRQGVKARMGIAQTNKYQTKENRNKQIKTKPQQIKSGDAGYRQSSSETASICTMSIQKLN